MDREAELAAARDLNVEAIAREIESIGFACQRCGSCCTAEADEPHTATIFPDEVRAIDGTWPAIARPMPYGLETGETFEWALQVDDCGDCVFYDDEEGCQIYEDRPLICQTYPFRVDPRDGTVETSECPGLGEEMSHEEAQALARTLKRRAIVEAEQALALRAAYEPVTTDGPVVYDAEGPKQVDGTPIDPTDQGQKG